ncbi:MAG: adenylosuccinate synthetase [Myxococcales bacterium]|nr:adenylosuccinate synthetase [Myxococcales bacterium]
MRSSAARAEHHRRRCDVTAIDVVLGLGFGDEGKGSIVDWLARRAIAEGGAPPLVIRWNGGPQAQHHVVTDDGRVHCFAQLGAASFVGARTHLAGDMAVDLYALEEELRELATTTGEAASDLRARVTIDPRCALVTPWHATVNLVREALRGGRRHGSTGRGIGEAKLGPIRMFAGELEYDFATRLREVRAGLLARASALAADDFARALIARASEADIFDAYLAAARLPIAVRDEAPAADHVIFESAQGSLLDRDHGFFPHVTPSRITRRAARDVARGLRLDAPMTVWGVLRAYHSRHGEGPFPSEDCELATRLPELHNREDGHAGRFRVGWFDAVLARYAIGFAGPIDRIAVTCLDRVAALPDRSIVTAWRDSADVERDVTSAIPVVQRVDDVATAISEALGRAIDVASYGPRAADKSGTKSA